MKTFKSFRIKRKALLFHLSLAQAEHLQCGEEEQRWLLLSSPTLLVTPLRRGVYSKRMYDNSIDGSLVLGSHLVQRKHLPFASQPLGVLATPIQPLSRCHHLSSQPAISPSRFLRYGSDTCPLCPEKSLGTYVANSL